MTNNKKINARNKGNTTKIKQKIKLVKKKLSKLAEILHSNVSQSS